MSKIEYVGRHRTPESEVFETRSSTSMWARRVLVPISAFMVIALGFSSVAFAEQQTHAVAVCGVHNVQSSDGQ